MNIKPVVYENLTAQQRIIASIEALARGDEDEKDRLVKSCPKKFYKQNDTAYSEMMEALMEMAMAIECDVRGEALNFLTIKSLDPEIAKICLQNIADIKTAWHEVLEAKGISPESMRKANPPQNPSLDIIIDYECMPDPNPDGVRKIKYMIEKYINPIK